MGLFSINEVYFGRTKEMEKLVDQMRILRRKYYGQPFFRNMNTDEDLLKFDRLIEDTFGFEAFALIIEPSGNFNAFTLPVSGQLGNKKAKNIMASKNGFKFDKRDGMCTSVFIYSRLFTDERFTDEEIVATILHELGHNFSASICTNGYLLSMTQKFLNAIILIMSPMYLLMPNGLKLVSHSNKVFAKYYVEFMKNSKSNKSLSDAIYKIRSFGKLLLVVQDTVFGLLEPFTIFSPVFIPIIVQNLVRFAYSKCNLIALVRTVLGKEEENVADNFASFYGFSKELDSALFKFENYYGGNKGEELSANIPIIGHLYNVMMEPFLLLIQCMDEHPTNEQRTANSITYMKRELNKEKIDPKMKKVIQRELEKTEELYDELVTNLDSRNTKYFSRLFSSIVLKIFGMNFDRPTNTHRKSLDDYDDAYERGSENMKSLNNVKIR